MPIGDSALIVPMPALDFWEVELGLCIKINKDGWLNIGNLNHPRIDSASIQFSRNWLLVFVFYLHMGSTTKYRENSC